MLPVLLDWNAGSDKRTRNILPNGFYKFLVHNVKELELLLMHNRWAGGVGENKLPPKQSLSDGWVEGLCHIDTFVACFLQQSRDVSVFVV